MRLHRVAAVFVAALLHGPRAGAQQTPDLSPYLMPDRAAEVALARSAASPQISDSATVMVLTRSGFVQAARGTNGFTCMVLHSFDSRIGDPGFWDARIRAPICLNPAAVRTVLREMLKRSEWIMAGVQPAEIAVRTRKAYASHELLMPDPGAMAYMLSPRQHLANSDPHWMPHLMFFFDRSFPAASFGTGGSPTTIIDGSVDDPEAPYLTLLVPVRRWSDGRLAMAGAH